MHTLRVLFTLFFLLPLTVEAQQATAEMLFERFKSASRFDFTYPREKVYLHLDQSAYLTGDTIWYKAYVVRASSLQPTTLSRVLYVELLNADGQQVEKQTLKLDSLGTACGAFSLRPPVYAGYHELRAFTREMVNWGPEACFSRVVPVFSPGKPLERAKDVAEADITELFIPQPSPNKRVSLSTPRPYVMQERTDRLLDFYPEGGRRVEGVSQRIAFKLTDGRGLAVEDTVKVFRSDGTLCANAVPEHEGMGDFLLPANFVEGYACIGLKNAAPHSGTDITTGKRYSLPADRAPYALYAEPTDSGLYIKVEGGRSAARDGRLLGLAVLNREKVCYFDTLTVMPAEAVELLVPRRALRGGLNRVELFDADGTGQATRLCWAPLTATDSLRLARVEVMQNQAAYAPFSPAVVKIKATDAEGRPVAGASLSLAVRDEAGNLLDNADGGMAAQLLLASEVRGYIHHPDLYFAREDNAHRRMLDLLLRVQGWQANAFSVMCGREPFDLQQPIESKLVLRGYVFKDNNRREPYPGLSLNLRAYRYEHDSIKGGTIEGGMVTDADGRFAFESQVDFEGDYLAQFTMRSGEKEKRRWSRLAIDRWFEPPLRPFYEPQLQLAPYNREERAAGGRPQPQTFEWKDTLQHAVRWLSGEAEVTARKKYKGFTGNRYTWKGGESTGIRKSAKYINIRKEWEHYKDMGFDPVITIWDLLGFLDNQVSYDRMESTQEPASTDNTAANAPTLPSDYPPSDYPPDGMATSDIGADPMAEEGKIQLTYHGRPVDVWVNNVTDTSPADDYLCSDYRSLTMTEENIRTNSLTGRQVRVSNLKYTFALYEEPFAWRMRNGKGREYRILQGFTPQPRFYSPDYRRFDLPDDADTRRTLLWEPHATTNAEGEAHVIFFTNCHPEQTLDISIRGIGPSGTLISHH